MNPETTQQDPTGGTHVEINEPNPEAETTAAEENGKQRKSAKSRSRRISSGKKSTKTDKGFAVPVGESGKTFDSVWQFGE
jgi:hypothetical protein